MIVVISPHLDDAVLSLGQYIAAAGDDVTVVTVFAGSPRTGLSPYDEACGFKSSSQAVQTRRREDRRACAALDADVVHLNFLDHQYGHPADDAVIIRHLGRFYRSDWLIFAPLGIGHPDHAQTARCARAARGEGTIVLYEELPYRVLNPEQAVDALAKVRAEGFAIAELPYPLEQGARSPKVQALAEYRSQFRTDETLNDPCFYVPERAWRVAR